MRSKRVQAGRNELLAGALVLFLLLALFDGTFDKLRTAYGDMRYRLAPDATRAMLLGNAHFDAKSAGMYDIERADYYFREAEKRDPTIPELYHQLARVAFIRGELPMALAYISKQIDTHGDTVPSSFYVKGLIEGYMGRYEDAARDYEKYLAHDPDNWAAVNDYAWVLLKSGRFEDAIPALERALRLFPKNPWLYNSYAIALYELGRIDEAYGAVQKAATYVPAVTEKEWRGAYPGNDPQSAMVGKSTFEKAIADNMHMIEERMRRSDVQ